MKRWQVVGDCFIEPVSLYYPTLQDVKRKFPNCDIKEDTDRLYMEYVHKILALSVEKMTDYRGRLIHKIPYNKGYYLVRLAYDTEDDTYYDFLEYQRHDQSAYVAPISWCWSSPKELFENVLDCPVIDMRPIRLSYTELQNIKPKVVKFHNKNGQVFWEDSVGYIYIAEKSDLPNKKNKTQWEKFHDNPNAIFVRCLDDNNGRMLMDWFESLDTFLITFNDIKAKKSPGCAMPRYEIKRQGYKALHPTERKNIFRLPYFNIQKELSLNESLNPHSKYQSLARQWAKLCEGYSWFGEWSSQIDFLETLIKAYVTYHNLA